MENTNKKISFSIIQIATEQFATIPDALNEALPSQIQHELTFGFDKENKRIYVRKLARFRHTEGSPFMIIAVACWFAINPPDWDELIVPESDKIVLPKDFATHLAMLVVGTMRGILYTKTENTNFNQFILPPVDVTALVPADITFE